MSIEQKADLVEQFVDSLSFEQLRACADIFDVEYDDESWSDDEWPDNEDRLRVKVAEGIATKVT